MVRRQVRHGRGHPCWHADAAQAASVLPGGPTLGDEAGVLPASRSGRELWAYAVGSAVTGSCAGTASRQSLAPKALDCRGPGIRPQFPQSSLGNYDKRVTNPILVVEVPIPTYPKPEFSLNTAMSTPQRPEQRDRVSSTVWA